MIRSIEVYAPFMGFDAMLRVDFEITSWGAPAVIDYVYGGHPSEPPEWEINEIGLTLSLDDGDGAEWSPEWWTRAWRVFANSERVEQAIIDDIASIDRPRRGRRYWDAA